MTDHDAVQISYEFINGKSFTWLAKAWDTTEEDIQDAIRRVCSDDKLLALLRDKK